MQLHEWGDPVHAALAEALAPAMARNDDRIDAVVAAYPNAIRGMADTCRVDAVPLRSSKFPTRLFDLCDSPARPIPLDTPAKVKRHVSALWPHHVSRLRALTGIEPDPSVLRNQYGWYDTFDQLYARAVSRTAREDLSHTLLEGLDTPIDAAAGHAITVLPGNTATPSWMPMPPKCARRIFEYFQPS